MSTAEERREARAAIRQEGNSRTTYEMTSMEGLLQAIKERQEWERSRPEPARPAPVLLRDDHGQVVTRETALSICKPVHMDAVDRFMRGESILLVDRMRTGKTMAARYAHNALALAGQGPGFVSEERLMLMIRDNERWPVKKFQILDNAFSKGTYEAFNVKTDDSTTARLRWREDVINKLRDMRGLMSLLVTARRLPEDVSEMDEDLQARWMELFDEVIEC